MFFFETRCSNKRKSPSWQQILSYFKDIDIYGLKFTYFLKSPIGLDILFLYL